MRTILRFLLGSRFGSFVVYLLLLPTLGGIVAAAIGGLFAAIVRAFVDYDYRKLIFVTVVFFVVGFYIGLRVNLLRLKRYRAFSRTREK